MGIYNSLNDDDPPSLGITTPILKGIYNTMGLLTLYIDVVTTPILKGIYNFENNKIVAYLVVTTPILKGIYNIETFCAPNLKSIYNILDNVV